MQSVSKINAYRNHQSQQVSNKNLKQFVYYNTNCFPQQSIAFTGKCGTFKELIVNRYLNIRLKKILQEFDLICQNLDENNLKFKGDITSDKCKNLLNYVTRKTKTIPVLSTNEDNFGKIERLTAEQEIKLSLAQKAELFSRFNLSITRKKLTNSIIETLEFLKYSRLFKDSSIAIQKTIDKSARAIRCFGLSKEVKNIVINSEDNFGVKLDIPDSLNLAENIYSRLAQHKKSCRSLPKEISFNDFDFFTTHNPALSANYVSRKKPDNYNEIILKYPSLTNKFSEKQIYFNPIFLLLRQSKKDFPSIFEDLEHELGHFWHNLEIGDNAFHCKRMNSLDGFLPIKDNNFLLDLKNKLSEKVCFVPNIDFAGRIDENLSEIIPDLQNMIDHRHDLEIEDILTKEIINKFNQIVQKLEEITIITSENFTDCPNEVIYALTSPKELVAFAIQKRHDHKYDPAFLKMLKSFGMPEIKD